MEISDDKFLKLFEDVASIKQALGIDMVNVQNAVNEIRADIKELKDKYFVLKTEICNEMSKEIKQHESELHIKDSAEGKQLKKRDNVKLAITIISLMIAIATSTVAIIRG